MKKTFLCVLMILMTAVISSSYITAGASADYTEAAGVLASLGIIKSEPDAEALESNVVTKIQAVEVLNAAFGPNAPMTVEKKTLFADIPTGNGYFRQVAIASQLGIVKSTDGINFMPNDNITVSELSKMLVRAAGYERMAEKYNYSKSGYITVAIKLDIIDKSNISEDDTVSEGQLYKAVYDALLLNPVISYINGENIEAYTEKSTTIMENIFGLKSTEGIYFADKYSSLYGNYSLKDNQFAVKSTDGTNYIFTSDEINHEYLGCNVKVFYRSEGHTEKALCVIKYENKELVITGDEFDNFDISDRTFYYHRNEEINSFTTQKTNKKISINNSDIDFIYNGQYTADISAVIEMLNGCGSKSGYELEKIVLVDNDRDSKYEIVIVDVYKDFFVSFVNKDNESVANPYGETVKYNDNDYFIVKTDKGEQSAFNKIAGNNVLRIKEGLTSPKLYTIFVTTDSMYARVRSKSVENGKTTLELEEAEQTNRGSGYIGSMVGGKDNEIPVIRCGVSNSFESHVDELLLTAYSTYKIFFNSDGELAGYTVFTFDKNSGILGVDNPVGANTYTAANFGVMLAVAKESSLTNKVRLKMYDYPTELRTMRVTDFDTAADFKIKNIEESCLFIENPSEFYIDTETGAVIQEKVDLYYKLKDEYEKYGEDGSKYSLDVLRFIFGNKLVIYKADSDYVIYEVQLPVYGKQEGRLSYMTVPGQTYYKRDGIYYSLYDGSQILFAGKSVNFIIPDPDCSYADCYELCFNGTYTNLKDEYTQKMDFYTFTPDYPTAQLAVTFLDYDTLVVSQGSSGVVTNRAKSGSEFGYNVDSYYIMGEESVTDWGYKRFYSIYPKTYKIAEIKTKTLGSFKYRYVNDSSKLGNVSVYSKKISDLSPEEILTDVEPGDLVTFYSPSFTYNTDGNAAFTAANVIYDYSNDKLDDGVVTSTNSNFGKRRFTMGKIYDINEDAVAVLPWFYEDKDSYEPGLSDCFISRAEKSSVVLCRKLKDGTFEVKRGEFADLYEGLVNNLRVVVDANSASSSTTGANSVFYLYLSE